MKRYIFFFALVLAVAPQIANAQYAIDSSFNFNLPGGVIAIDPVNNNVWIATCTSWEGGLQQQNADGNIVVRRITPTGTTRTWNWDGPGGSGLFGDGFDAPKAMVVYNGVAYITGVASAGAPNAEMENPFTLSVIKIDDNNPSNFVAATFQLKDSTAVNANPIESAGYQIIRDATTGNIYVAGTYLEGSEGQNLCLLRFDSNLSPLWTTADTNGNTAGAPPYTRVFKGAGHGDDIPIGLIGNWESYSNGTTIFALYVGAQVIDASPDHSQFGLIKWGYGGGRWWDMNWGRNDSQPDDYLTSLDVPKAMVKDPLSRVIYMTGYSPQVDDGSDWATIALNLPTQGGTATVSWAQFASGTKPTGGTPAYSISGSADQAWYIDAAADSLGNRLIAVSGIAYHDSNNSEELTIRYNISGAETGPRDWYGAVSQPIGVRIDPYNLGTLVGIDRKNVTLTPRLLEIPSGSTHLTASIYSGNAWTPKAMIILPQSNARAWVYMTGLSSARTVRWIPD